MALRDTLKSIQTRVAEDADFERRKPEIIETWRASVLWLEQRVSDWLVEYEKDGTLSFSWEGFVLQEELLGSYQSQGLNIHVGPITIRIRPVARIIIGGVGRVDMYREGRPSDEERVLFVRLNAEKTDVWALRRPKASVTRSPDLEPLTKSTFEAALELLLK